MNELLLVGLGLFGIGMTVFSWQKGKRRHTPAWRVGLRVAAIGVLVVALGEPYGRLSQRRLAVVCLWDASASVTREMRQHVAPQVRSLWNALPRDAERFLVVFGETPQIVPEDTLPPLETYSATHLEAALNFAVSLLPPGGDRRILLVSDGAENQGDARAVIPRLRAEGIPVHVIPLESKPLPDVRVEALQVPPRSRRNVPLPVTVLLTSRETTPIRLRFLVDGTFVASQTTSLPSGTTPLTWTSPPLESGEHTLSVVVEADKDSYPDNNRATAFTFVSGEPRVLYVGGETAFRDALFRLSGVRVELFSPERFPSDAALLEPYDAVIWEDIPAHSLTEAQQKALAHYVREGGGWISVGGPHTYGLGDWDGTPLEEAAPITMQPQEKKQPLALLLLLDKSGSMAHESNGTPKLTLALQATQAAAEALREGDALGLIAFDAKPRLTLPFTEERSSLLNAVEKLRPGSGTNILRALEAAREMIATTDYPRKHVVLLSDGQSEGDLITPTQQIVEQGATVSTIAVGSDATPHLAEIARVGKGTFTALEDLRTLPRILMREARRGNEILIQETTEVKIGKPSPWLGSSFPPVEGYVAATPKPSAEVLLKTSREDPLLVTWRYGLGKALAFLSDGGNRWTRSWALRPDYVRHIGTWVRWVLRPTPNETTEISAKIVGAELHLNVAFAEEINPTVRVRTPDSLLLTLPLERHGKGYSTRFPLREEGTYEITLLNGEEILHRQKIAYEGGAESSSFPNRPLLETLAAETGGLLNPPEWGPPRGEPLPQEIRLNGILFSLGMGLVLLEWILRRGGKRKPSPSQEKIFRVETPPTLARLREAKTRVTLSYAKNE